MVTPDRSLRSLAASPAASGVMAGMIFDKKND
jgi:hypothetical protein